MFYHEVYEYTYNLITCWSVYCFRRPKAFTDKQYIVLIYFIFIYLIMKSYT